MKLLTVSLCVCAVMALTLASAIRRRSACEAEAPEKPSEIQTAMANSENTPPPTTEPSPPFGVFPQCPDGSWQMFQIRCLLYVPKKMTWSAAQSNCMGYGLAAAGGSYSKDIVKVLKAAGHTSGQVWVGGCVEDVDFWDWSTNGYGQQKLTCIEATPGGNPSGCLNSTQCEPELPSICSWTLM